MKLLLKKCKTEKKKKNLDKVKQLDLHLVQLKNANSPNNLQSALKELKKFKLLIKIYMRLNQNY